MTFRLTQQPRAEGDPTSPDSQGRIWYEDAYGGLIRPGESNSSGDGGAVYFGPQPPADTAFEAGAVFIQDTTFQSYVFDGAVWVETTGRAAGGADTEAVQELEDRIELLEKAVMPYVEFPDGEDDRWIRYSPASSHQAAKVTMNQFWNSSASGNTLWAWMVTWPGESESVDIDDLSTERLAEIGYEANSIQEGWHYLYLYPPNKDDLPDITIQLLVQDTIEGFQAAMEYSKPFKPRETWINQDTTGGATTKKPQKQSRGFWRESLAGLLKNSKQETDS